MPHQHVSNLEGWPAETRQWDGHSQVYQGPDYSRVHMHRRHGSNGNGNRFGFHNSYSRQDTTHVVFDDILQQRVQAVVHPRAMFVGCPRCLHAHHNRARYLHHTASHHSLDIGNFQLDALQGSFQFPQQHLPFTVPPRCTGPLYASPQWTQVGNHLVLRKAPVQCTCPVYLSSAGCAAAASVSSFTFLGTAGNGLFNTQLCPYKQV